MSSSAQTALDRPSREPVSFRVFSASLRKGSLNTQLAELAGNVIERSGVAVDLASMDEFRMSLAQRRRPDRARFSSGRRGVLSAPGSHGCVRDQKGQCRIDHCPIRPADVRPPRGARVELRASGESIPRRDPTAPEKLTPQGTPDRPPRRRRTDESRRGDALSLSPKTIEFHRTRIYRKLEVQSRSDLIRLFASNGQVAGRLLRASQIQIAGEKGPGLPQTGLSFAALAQLPTAGCRLAVLSGRAWPVFANVSAKTGGFGAITSYDRPPPDRRDERARVPALAAARRRGHRRRGRGRAWRKGIHAEAGEDGPPAGQALLALAAASARERHLRSASAAAATRSGADAVSASAAAERPKIRFSVRSKRVSHRTRSGPR